MLQDIFDGVQSLQEGLGNVIQTDYVRNCIIKVDTVTKRLQSIYTKESQDCQKSGAVGSEASSGAAGSSVRPVKPSKRERSAPDHGNVTNTSPFKLLLTQLHDRVSAMESILERDLKRLLKNHAQELNLCQEYKTLSALVAGSDVTSDQFQSLADVLVQSVDSWILLNQEPLGKTKDLEQSIRIAVRHFVAGSDGVEEER